MQSQRPERLLFKPTPIHSKRNMEVRESLGDCIEERALLRGLNYLGVKVEIEEVQYVNYLLTEETYS